MEYLIAVFSVRTETLMFNQFLKRSGINSVVINTPKEANTSCGISVKFPIQSFNVVKRAITPKYTSFIGFFKVTKNNYGGLTVVRIK